MCGLDPRRIALTGAEMRPCWAAPDPAVETVPGGTSPAAMARATEFAGRRPRTFVPVDELVAMPEPTPVIVPAPSAVSQAGRAWSLWGDLEA